MPVLTSDFDDQRFGKEFLEDILEWIAAHFEPADVFSEARLKEWALENDFTEE